MTHPRISDHALVRFLERAGALDVEGLRARLAASLGRACAAADTIDARDYLIQADGLLYVVRDGTVTTVLDHLSPGASAAVLTRGSAGRTAR
jgi:hypothetical protein